MVTRWRLPAGAGVHASGRIFASMYLKLRQSVGLAILGVSTLACTGTAEEFVVTRLFDVPEAVRNGTRLIATHDGVFIDADGPNGHELYGTDGFREFVSDINPLGHAHPYAFAEYQGNLYFAARSTNGNDAQYEWYRTQGLSVAVVPTMDLDEQLSTLPMWPFVYDDKLFFHGNGVNGRELYAFDGESTSEVYDINPGPGDAFSERAWWRSWEVNNKVVFSAGTGNGASVFALDGMTVSRLSPAEIRVGLSTGFEGASRLYFVGGEPNGTPSSDTYLYATDGVELERLVHVDKETILSQPIYVNEAGGDVYFDARTATDETTMFWRDSESGSVIPVTYNNQILHRTDEGGVVNNKLVIRDFIDGQYRVFSVEEGDATELVLPEGIIGDQPFGLHDGWLYFEGYGRTGQDSFLLRTDGIDVVQIEGTKRERVTLRSDFDSTPLGLFQRQRDSLSWTDGEILQNIGLAPHQGEYFEGAYYVYGAIPGEAMYSVFRIAPKFSVTRVDFNRNGLVDVGDIDITARQVRGVGDSDWIEATFDLDGDGAVTATDYQMLIHDFANTFFGDSNLDGEFNSTDFVGVFQAGKYETEEYAFWAEGDWNGDGEFNSSDMVTAFADGGYEKGMKTDAAVVPEPTAALLLLIGLTQVAVCRRRPRS